MQAAALATPSGMTSVLGLDEPAIDELCRRVAPHGRLWKANLLGPGNIVVSGEDRRRWLSVEPIASELGASPRDPAEGGRSSSLGSHEAGRRPARSGAGHRRDQARLASGLTRIVDASPHTEPADLGTDPGRPGDRRRPLEDSIRRMMADGIRHLLRGRPRARPDRSPQTHRPQDALHEYPGPLKSPEALTLHSNP